MNTDHIWYQDTLEKLLGLLPLLLSRYHDTNKPGDFWQQACFEVSYRKLASTRFPHHPRHCLYGACCYWDAGRR